MVIVYVAEAVCALLAVASIIRYDLRGNEFTTGAPLLAAALAILIVAILRLAGVRLTYHEFLSGVAVCVLLLGIARFYYDRRHFAQRDR